MPEMFDSSFDDMNECIESVEDTFYYDIDYAIKEENEMTSDEYEETMHNLVDYYHLSEKKIEKLVLYKVMMTRYYPGTTSGSMGAEDIPMLKYDGKWYILFG
jgi:regulatory protein YycH of two-component signal transduction system YycFG